MTPSPLGVAVVGGGPGGLTLARVLQRAGIPVTVLERDPGPAARIRGGPLDLHGDTGQVAIRAAGLHDEWLARARTEDQAMTLLDPHGEVLVARPADPEDTGSPEVDRTQLRDLLLGALEPGTVRWGAGVDEVRARRDGRPEAVLPDGAVVTADLVVGADGAWSRVRPLLSAATPTYTGVTFVEFTVDAADVPAVIGRGSTMVHGPDRALGAQRLADGSLWPHVALRVPEDWARRCHGGAPFPVDDDAAARALLGERLAGWSDELLAVLRAGRGPFTPRRMRALPNRHVWPHRPGVTLLGDAAHLMSPFGGQGANLAMLDAADLAGELAGALDGDGDLDAAVVRYEQRMWPRAQEAATASQRGLETAIAADAPAGSLAFLRSSVGEPAGVA